MQVWDNFLQYLRLEVFVKFVIFKRFTILVHLLFWRLDADVSDDVTTTKAIKRINDNLKMF